MHEWSLARNLVQAVKDQLPPGESRSVESVTVKLGEFNRILPGSLLFCFGLACRGTSLEGARLEIESVPIRCGCGACGTGFEPGQIVSVCPVCGTGAVELWSGNELDISGFHLTD